MKQQEQEYLPNASHKLLNEHKDGDEESSKTTEKEKEQKVSRYECFCFNQYLSYSALYCHLKKKHLEFFQKNRSFNSTNMVITLDPAHGYKIKKLLKERISINPNQQLPSKAKVNPNVPKVEYFMRPQYQFDAVQIEINQSLRRNELKKRILQINTKILQKQQDLMEQLQKNMQDYEDVMHLVRIKQISDIINMKIEELSQDEEIFSDQ